MIEATSDERTLNNVMRHGYRVLNEGEKLIMGEIKNQGLLLWDLFDTMEPSREVSIAKTRVEEAVMWAVKSITR